MISLFALSHFDLRSVWLIAILTDSMPTKNMKLLMLNALDIDDDVMEIPTRLEAWMKNNAQEINNATELTRLNGC